MTITSGTHPKLLWPGLQAIWGNEYKDHPAEWSKVFDELSSEKSYEESQELAGFGLAPVKSEGGSISYATTVNGYVTRFTNVNYGLGFIVTEEAVADNLYKEQAERRTSALRRSLRHTEETVCANIFNRAFDSNYVGGDGLEMVSTAHVTANGTQSNELAVAADLSEASLEDMLIQIMNATDTNGLRIALMGEQLLVPPNQAFEATRILKSTLQSNSAENNINAMRSMGLLPKGVMVWHFLTDTDAWFVKTDWKGLKHFSRKKAGLGKDSDFETGNLKHKGTMRFAVGWDDWRPIFGSAGT
jgi:hypothetical protein